LEIPVPRHIHLAIFAMVGQIPAADSRASQFPGLGTPGMKGSACGVMGLLEALQSCGALVGR
jgi:hypothetical protein